MAVFPVELESDRLRYEALRPESFDPYELYEHVHTDAPAIDEITEYVTWDPYEHPQEAFEWVDRCGENFENDAKAAYVLRPKAGDRAGEFAGVAGLNPEWNRRRATLGMWLRKSFWGKGYSGERAGRLLELAFGRLDLEIVAITHDPENENSRRAIEKYVERFGGHREGRIRNDMVVDGEPRDSIRYSISSDEWAESRTES
jgi:ribosomal-protein-alanine N-acetyltransferase